MCGFTDLLFKNIMGSYHILQHNFVIYLILPYWTVLGALIAIRKWPWSDGGVAYLVWCRRRGVQGDSPRCYRCPDMTHWLWNSGQ